MKVCLQLGVLFYFFVQSLSIFASGALLIFSGVLFYKGIYQHFETEKSIWLMEGTKAEDSLMTCIKGMELLFLSALPSLISKSFSLYLKDLVEFGRVTQCTKGALFQSKLVMSGLLIGFVSAVLVGGIVSEQLTFGKIALIAPVHMLLTYYYIRAHNLGSSYHRPSGSIREEKNYTLIEDGNMDRAGSAIWFLGVLLGTFVLLVWGILGVVEIGRGVIGAVFKDTITVTDAIGLGLRGVEFLLISPLAILIMHGVSSYSKDLNAHGYVSRKSRSVLLEVKTLLAGFLLSLSITEMVLRIINGNFVRNPSLHIETVSEGESTKYSIDLFSDGVTQSFSLEFMMCAIVSILMLGFYYLKLLSYNASLGD